MRFFVMRLFVFVKAHRHCTSHSLSLLRPIGCATGGGGGGGEGSGEEAAGEEAAGEEQEERWWDVTLQLV